MYVNEMVGETAVGHRDRSELFCLNITFLITIKRQGTRHLDVPTPR